MRTLPPRVVVQVKGLSPEELALGPERAKEMRALATQDRDRAASAEQPGLSTLFKAELSFVSDS